MAKEEISLKIKLLNNSFKNSLKETMQAVKTFSSKAKTSMSKFARHAKRAFTSIGRAGKTAFKAVGIAAAALTTSLVGVMSGLNQTAREMDKIAKLSLRLNVSTDALQELEYIAARSGVSFQNLTIGMQRMARRIGEAAMSGGPLADALGQIGLNAKELVGLSPDKMLFKLGDALNKVGLSNQQLAVAFKFLDTEGVGLLQAFRSNLGQVRKDFASLGTSLSPKDFKLAEEYQDALTDISTLFEGFKRRVVVGMVPAIKNLAAKFKEAFKGDAIKDLIKTITEFASKGINKLTSALPQMIKGFKGMVSQAKELMILLENIAKTIDVVVNGLGRTAGYIAAKFEGLNQNPQILRDMNKPTALPTKVESSSDVIKRLLASRAEADNKLNTAAEKLKMAGDTQNSAANKMIESVKLKSETAVGQILNQGANAELGRILGGVALPQAQSKEFDRAAQSIVQAVQSGNADPQFLNAMFERLKQEKKVAENLGGKSTTGMANVIKELGTFLKAKNDKKTEVDVKVSVKTNKNFDAEIEKKVRVANVKQFAEEAAKIGK